MVECWSAKELFGKFSLLFVNVQGVYASSNIGDGVAVVDVNVTSEPERWCCRGGWRWCSSWRWGGTCSRWDNCATSGSSSSTSGCSACRSSALCSRIFHEDGDLALEEKLSTIGVFEHVRFNSGHQIGWVFEVVQKESIDGTSIVIQEFDFITISVIDEARVNGHTEHIGCFTITGPFVVDLLTDKGELDWLTGWTTVEDFVSADGHRHQLGLELGGEHADFQLGRDGLVCLHVEALDAVHSIDFRLKLGMERNNHNCSHKHSLWVQ
jgi:hypothetical protein